MDEKREWKTRLAGVTFDNRMETIERYALQNSKYQLIRQPENKYDINAIMVTADGHDIGFIPNSKGRKLADELAALLDAGTELKVHFRRLLLNDKTGKKVGIIVRIWE